MGAGKKQVQSVFKQANLKPFVLAGADAGIRTGSRRKREVCAKLDVAIVARGPGRVDPLGVHGVSWTRPARRSSKSASCKSHKPMPWSLV